MDKDEALALLGGSATEAARAIGITPQAVTMWPPTLPPRLRDRVQAALWRMAQARPGRRRGRKPAPAGTNEPPSAATQ